MEQILFSTVLQQSNVCTAAFHCLMMENVWNNIERNIWNKHEVSALLCGFVSRLCSRNRNMKANVDTCSFFPSQTFCGSSYNMNKRLRLKNSYFPMGYNLRFRNHFISKKKLQFSYYRPIIIYKSLIYLNSKIVRGFPK